MFVTPHIPGALYKVMTPIAEAGLNMVKLESRPSRQENWTYIFFLDLEGHIDQPEVKETVEKIRRICLFTKVLGSYPIRNRIETKDDITPNRGFLHYRQPGIPQHEPENAQCGF